MNFAHFMVCLVCCFIVKVEAFSIMNPSFALEFVFRKTVEYFASRRLTTGYATSKRHRKNVHAEINKIKLEIAI